MAFVTHLSVTDGHDLTFGAKVPVIKVAAWRAIRKTRSAPTETVDGAELPSYRGDIINDLDFTSSARIPDPSKMLQVTHRLRQR